MAAFFNEGQMDARRQKDNKDAVEEGKWMTNSKSPPRYIRYINYFASCIENYFLVSEI